ncbi:hypothetical protein QFC20_005541 [Naganishia adeliensis]|uniref:Uncharacterized protein n=1 Tax=Naganishia adeliensis TaxID=92952 RepID=A0ACC2VLW3_9TREE|nr:hypothetical protein QFC20_005541 [Naganishia adeliensis]
MDNAPRHSFQALNNVYTIAQPYAFVKELGQGAYGCVISARHETSGEMCAIKKITNIFSKKILTKRCLREIKLLHHLRGHKNITCLYDMDIVPDPPGTWNFNEVYLYEELMEADLHAIIRSGQPLSDAHFQSFLYQTLCGLKYIHSANVLHRDLKPGNLLVNADCELKICDFGLARGFQEGGSAETGQAGFMTEFDMWSVGCILAELLGGRPIFKGRDYVDQLNQILNVLGTPTEDTLRRVGSPRAQEYIRSLPIKPKQQWHQLYPKANPLALDLLSKLLCFDPAKRISCEEALNHPYLSVWHDPADEPVCASTFDFGFESEESSEGMKAMIITEVAAFRQQVRNQIRAAPVRKETLPVEVPETAPNPRAATPFDEDPSSELEKELAGTRI